MKRVKNSVRVTALLVMLCMMLTMSVFAAENGSVWITETSDAEGTVAAIITDTTVTDGLVTVTYDADALTYEGVSVNDGCVAMHAVNADEPGEVRISWVAPGEYAPEGNEWLFQVNFSGASDEKTGLEGTVTGGEITEAPVATDKTELEKAVLSAEGLNEDDYTAESWAALEEALSKAKEVLDDPAATQEEIDAAAEALLAAIDALELAEAESGDVDKSELKKAIAIAEGLKKGNYTESSWKALEKALKNAKAVMDDADATQKEVDAATAALKAAIAGLKLSNAPDTGDNADLVLPAVLAVVCVFGIAGVLFVMKKKEGKAA